MAVVLRPQVICGSAALRAISMGMFTYKVSHLTLRPLLNRYYHPHLHIRLVFRGSAEVHCLHARARARVCACVRTYVCVSAELHDIIYYLDLLNFEYCIAVSRKVKQLSKCVMSK